MPTRSLKVAELLALVEEVERDIPFRPALQRRDPEAKDYLADAERDPHDSLDGYIRHRRAWEREEWIQEDVEKNQPFSQKALFV